MRARRPNRFPLRGVIILPPRRRPRRMGDLSTIDLRQAIVDQANAQGIPPGIAIAVATAESGIAQWTRSGNLVVSSAGAIGVMQLMPATAAQLGVDPADPLQNIQGGVTYLAQMFNKYGDWWTALAAYNWGPANVDKAIARGKDPSTWPSAGYATSTLAAAGVSSSDTVQTFAPDAGALPDSSPPWGLILLGAAGVILAVNSLLE